MPDLQAIMVDHEALGVIGKTKHFAGYEAMEATFTWNAFYADTLRQIGNPFQHISLALHANMDEIDGQQLQSQISVVTDLRGTFMNYPTGSFSQMENVDGLEMKMSVFYLKQTIDGVEIFEFDAANNLLRVNGVDLTAQFNNNIGG
jgi:P2 family phage contractile tail tube protein